MIKYITGHWELKLVAMAIALALWTYTNGQVRAERTITVQLPDSAVTLPADYRVTDIQPSSREFNVTLSIPENTQHRLTSDAIIPHLVISDSNLRQGQQSFPITNRILGLNDDIRIVHSDSQSSQLIRVFFAAVSSDTLPVQLPRLLGVPPGIEMSVTIEPTRVKVSGTSEELALYRSLPTGPTGTPNAVTAPTSRMLMCDPILLNDIDPHLRFPRIEHVRLTIHGDKLTVLDAVMANIVLRPISAERTFGKLPLHLLLPKDFEATNHITLPAQIQITVHGPEDLLKNLSAELDLCVYVNLALPPQPDRAVEIPVSLLAPAGVSMDPISVPVTIEAIAKTVPVPAK